MPTEIKLKSCPFCNIEPIFSNKTKGWNLVHKDDCLFVIAGCGKNWIFYSWGDDVINGWNTRAPSKPTECKACSGAGLRWHGPDDDCCTECKVCNGTGEVS